MSLIDGRGRASALLTRHPISWEEFDQGVWVGRADGADVALIEAVDSVFVPSMLDEQALGVWPTLSTAQHDVEVRLRPRPEWGRIVMHCIGAAGFVATVLGVAGAVFHIG